MAGANKRTLRGKARSWVMGVSSSGKEQIAVSFAIREGEGERFLAWYGYFTEATADRTIESLRFMGFEGDDLSQLEGLDKNEVELVVEDETYTPEGGEPVTKEKIQWVNRGAGALVKTALVGEQLGSFAAQMKARFRAVDAAAGKRITNKPGAAKPAAAPGATGPRGDEPPPMGDADIPF